MNRLRSYEPLYAELDIENFLMQTAYLHQYLQQVGPDQVGGVVEQLGLGNPGTHSPSLKSENLSTIQLPVLQRLKPA